MPSEVAYKMLTVSFLMILLLAIAACSVLREEKNDKKFPSLENIDAGDHYEIQKISGYPESTLIHIKANQTYIVSTRLRTFERFHWFHYWRISADGELLDSFANHSVSYFSLAGVYFGEDWYNDWPLTGDKQNKLYDKVINRKDLNMQELNQLLAGSTQILWDSRSFHEGQKSRIEYYFYVQKDNHWSLLISDEALFKQTQTVWPKISHVRFSVSDLHEPIEGYLIPEEIEKHYPVTNLLWTKLNFTPQKNTVNNLQFKSFKKSYSVSPSFMSQQSWTGKVGSANFELLFNQQIFSFQTYCRASSHANIEEYNPDLSMFSKDDHSFLLMQLQSSGGGSSRDDAEAGIYILRKKQPAGLPKNISTINIEGFQSITPFVRWVIDNNGSRFNWPEKFSAREIALPAPIQSHPVYLDLSLKLPEPAKTTFNIIIGETTWNWSNNSSIYLILYFNPDEIGAAAKQLGNNNLAIRIQVKNRDDGIELIPAVESAGKVIQLKDVRIISQPSDKD